MTKYIKLLNKAVGSIYKLSKDKQLAVFNNIHHLIADDYNDGYTVSFILHLVRLSSIVSIKDLNKLASIGNEEMEFYALLYDLTLGLVKNNVGTQKILTIVWLFMSNGVQLEEITKLFIGKYSKVIKKLTLKLIIYYVKSDFNITTVEGVMLILKMKEEKLSSLQMYRIYDVYYPEEPRDSELNELEYIKVRDIVNISHCNETAHLLYGRIYTQKTVTKEDIFKYVNNSLLYDVVFKVCKMLENKKKPLQIQAFVALEVLKS